MYTDRCRYKIVVLLYILTIQFERNVHIKVLYIHGKHECSSYKRLSHLIRIKLFSANMVLVCPAHAIRMYVGIYVVKTIALKC
jgi:hypothetical protein